MGSHEAPMLDTYGVPEFYADHIGAMEDAGNGMVRIIKCVTRQGVIIPVYSFISPATTLLYNNEHMRAFARRVLGMEHRASH